MKWRVSMLLLLLAVLTGCAGKREINDLAIVMAVGLDKGDKAGEVRLTAQVVRPADARGQTGAPSGNTGDPIWSASAAGPSIFAAIRNLASFSSRRVFWAHNYVIVINEDLAKEGIADIIDFFTRNTELRMRTWVVVTPDEAREIVSATTGLEVLPGEALHKLFRYSTISVAAPRSELLDIQSAYLGENTEPVIARVRLVERGVSNEKAGQAATVKQVELAGAGVFKGDKLVGILNRREALGLIPFIEKVPSQIITLPCPTDTAKPLSLELKNQTFQVQPRVRNGKPSFRIQFSSSAEVTEAGCSFHLADQQAVAKLEESAEKRIRTDFARTIEKVQTEYKSDVLEFGKVLENEYPAEWRTISRNWAKIFPKVPVDIQVQVVVKGSGLLYKPTKSGKRDGS